MEKQLQQLEDIINEDIWDAWKIHPVTEYFKLWIQIKIDEKDELLKSGNYLYEDHGISVAMRADGARTALEDLLEITFADEETLDDNTSGTQSPS